MHYDRALRALSCALIVLSACARTRLSDGQLRATGIPDAANSGSGAGSGAGAPAGGAGNVGGPAPGAGAPAPPPGTTLTPPGTTPPGTAGGAAPPPPIAGNVAPPPMGMAGRPADGFDPNDVLNPQRCASDHPFVLSIDPGGRSGEVQGWLESAAAVRFDESGLPRFGLNGFGDESNSELTLWWSIAEISVDGRPGALWLYGNGTTEVAYTGLAISRRSATRASCRT